MSTFQTMLFLLLKKGYLVFLWKNKRDKIKRVGLYQDYDEGGLRMPDLECMIKALRMAWTVPRLLNGKVTKTGRPYLITSSRDMEA